MRKRVSDIYIIPILLSLFTVVMICTSSITFIEGLKFLVYQIFGIFFPGVLMCYWLAIPCLSPGEKGILGFGLGYIMVIIQYFVFSFWGALLCLHYFQIFVAIFVIGYLVYKRHNRRILCEAEVSFTFYLLFLESEELERVSYWILREQYCWRLWSEWDLLWWRNSKEIHKCILLWLLFPLRFCLM